jgi:hypothetical protein
MISINRFLMLTGFSVLSLLACCFCLNALVHLFFYLLDGATGKLFSPLTFAWIYMPMAVFVSLLLVMMYRMRMIGGRGRITPTA